MLRRGRFLLTQRLPWISPFRDIPGAGLPCGGRACGKCTAPSGRCGILVGVGAVGSDRGREAGVEMVRDSARLAVFGLDDPRVQTCPQGTVIIFMVTFKRWAYLTHSHGLPSLYVQRRSFPNLSVLGRAAAGTSRRDGCLRICRE